MSNYLFFFFFLTVGGLVSRLQARIFFFALLLCCNTKFYFSTDQTSCDRYLSFVGLIAEKKMCVDVQVGSTLTVTLSKPIYEQLLKTLDNVSFGGDIDDVSDSSLALHPKSPCSIPPQQSASAPDLVEIKNVQPKVSKTVLSKFSSSKFCTL